MTQPDPNQEKLHALVVWAVDAISQRHSQNGNINIDMATIAAGLLSARLARQAGLQNMDEFIGILAANAPEDLQNTKAWVWPTDLPHNPAIFQTETIALQELEAELVESLNNEELSTMHAALAIAMYPINLAEHARQYVDPHSVLGVLQTSLHQGFTPLAAKPNA